MPLTQQPSLAASMIQNIGALAGVAGSAVGVNAANDKYIGLIESRSVISAISDRLKLQDHYLVKDQESAIEVLRDNLKVNTDSNGFLVVSVRDRDPGMAANIANGLIEELSAVLSRLALGEARARRVFFEAQIKEARKNLDVAETDLRASGVDLGALNVSPVSAVEGLARIKAQVAAQEVLIAGMKKSLADSAPELRRATAELVVLKSQLAALQEAKQVLPGSYAQRLRDFKYFEMLYEVLAKQYELAKIDEGRDYLGLQVVDPAEPSARPVSPNRLYFFVWAWLLTFLMMSAWIFIRESVLEAKRDPEMSTKLEDLRRSFRKNFGRGV